MLKIFNLFGNTSSRNSQSEPDTSLLNPSPSVSGLAAPVSCAIGTVAAVAQCVPSSSNVTTAIVELNENKPLTDQTLQLPTTPNSTTSTAPLLSPPNSPDPLPPAQPPPTEDSSPAPASPTSADTMPAKTTNPVIITTTATAEVIDENRFSILAKESNADEVDIYTFPSPPKDDLNMRDNLQFNTSAGSTVSTAATPSPSTSHKSGGNTSDSSVKKKTHHKNHNNNHQGDVNSIESISDNTKIPNIDLEWIDDLLLEHNANEVLQKNKHKKKKKHSTAKELDQLDGVPAKPKNGDASINDDEKVVKCLYYTLMCCECTIS